MLPSPRLCPQQCPPFRAFTLSERRAASCSHTAFMTPVLLPRVPVLGRSLARLRWWLGRAACVPRGPQAWPPRHWTPCTGSQLCLRKESDGAEAWAGRLAELLRCLQQPLGPTWHPCAAPGSPRTPPAPVPSSTPPLPGLQLPPGPDVLLSCATHHLLPGLLAKWQGGFTHLTRHWGSWVAAWHPQEAEREELCPGPTAPRAALSQWCPCCAGPAAMWPAGALRGSGPHASERDQHQHLLPSCC